ncbi:MAG: DUF5915 domain-containing protein, partial [Candidatus Bathyarchaeota archaeon]|nr:DUF5915 domain-containing protein [Candidatus Bathyarchaeota archaeon]
DIVRRIQALRKSFGFDINDHIDVYYRGDPEIIEVFTEELEYIKTETLAEVIQEGTSPSETESAYYEIGGLSVTLGLVRHV